MKGNTNYRIAILCFATCLFIFTKMASGQYASPYSRYGLGDLNSEAISAGKAMGGITAAYISATNINYANPASYASLTRTTFDIGFSIDGAGINTKDSNYRSLNASLNHFAFVIVPSAKHNNWAISAGLLPYSSVDYNFTQVYNSPTLGPYNQVNSADGSLYKLYIGGAYRIKGFSIGANIGYIFGKISYQKSITLTDSLNAYNTANVTNFNAHGLYYNVGVLYQKLIYHNSSDPDPRTDLYAMIGIYGTSGTNLNAKISNYWDRYYYDVNGNLVIQDTVEADLTQKGKITMPYNITGGVMFGNERFWLVGADFSYTNWSVFSSPLNNGALGNTWRLSAGFQLTPKYDDRKFFNHVQYRAGFYYGPSQFMYQGNSLTEGAATLGLGIPFKTIAHLNFTGEFGTRGGGGAPITENFYRFSLGLVLNDLWFVRRKFD